MRTVICRRCGAESQGYQGEKLDRCACGGTREWREGMSAPMRPRGSQFIAADNSDKFALGADNYRAAPLLDSDEN